MTYVVTESCVKCKYTDCVDVCPVDAFREGPNFLVIDPVDCINCNVCVDECPVGAIYEESGLLESQKDFIAINAKFARQWPLISASKDPLPDANEWATVVEKKHLIKE